MDEHEIRLFFQGIEIAVVINIVTWRAEKRSLYMQYITA